MCVYPPTQLLQPTLLSCLGWIKYLCSVPIQISCGISILFIDLDVSIHPFLTFWLYAHQSVFFTKLKSASIKRVSLRFSTYFNPWFFSNITEIPLQHVLSLWPTLTANFTISVQSLIRQSSLSSALYWPKWSPEWEYYVLSIYSFH